METPSLMHTLRFAAGLLLLGAWASPATREAGMDRPAHWAQPVALPGVPNLHRVSPGLYRSAQPTAAGMRELEALGIRTVISLRSFHSDRGELAGTGLQAESITMKAWHPEEKELIRFLRLVTAAEKAPVLVHCQHGADRTGLACAVYRLAVCGWSREEAWREMRDGGFGYHSVWANLPRTLARLDLEKLRREAGVPAPTPAPAVTAPQ